MVKTNMFNISGIFELNMFFFARRVWRYKGVIIIRISKNRQHNGQKKKYTGIDKY
jgi:hypothetical protein